MDNLAKFREKFGNVSDEWLENKITGDGHAVVDPAYYLNGGFEESFIDSVTDTMKSDAKLDSDGIWQIGNPKYCIFREEEDDETTVFFPGGGWLVPEVKGVYNLNFLEKLAQELGITEHHSLTGRGFRARCIVEMLRKWLTS